MPFDPNFRANIKMFKLLYDGDRVALAEKVDDLNVPSVNALRGPQ